MATKQSIDGLVIQSQGSAITGGSGDKTVTVTGYPNMGRHARESKLLISVPNTAISREVIINQSGADLSVKDNNNKQYSKTSGDAQRSIAIKGTTNAQWIQVRALTADATTGAFTQAAASVNKVAAYFKSDGNPKFPASLNNETPAVITLPTAIKLDTATGRTNVLTTGASPLTDLGATSTYSYEYAVTVPVNTAEQDCYYAIRMIATGTDVDGNSMTSSSIDIIITSGKGSVFLEVRESEGGSIKSEYNLDSNNSVSFFVDSNTTWEITKTK